MKEIGISEMVMKQGNQHSQMLLVSVNWHTRGPCTWCFLCLGRLTHTHLHGGLAPLVLGINVTFSEML